MTKWNAVALFIALAVSPSLALADSGSFTNSGGSASVATGVTITSNVTTPAGTLTITCPATGSSGCVGGSLVFASSDGTTSLNATFSTGGAVESCSGGGRGGHITCGYTLSNGLFSGTYTLNGATQAINGVTSQAWTVGYSPSGTTAYNSAYTPFYYSDSEQILRADDLKGTNQITFGSQGGGVGQFYGAYGIALDSAGRIYVADTYNCRVVRMDDMNGTNWTTYGGTCGAGQGQFYDPNGIAVDSLGRVYVMDSGNSRLVRIDNMGGTNWTVFSNIGSGTGQVSYYQWVTVDSAFHIYIPDAGNSRIVRMDDMTGTNFTTLSQVTINGVTHSFASPVALALDSAGRMVVADNGSIAPEVIRVNDMTGAGWTSIYVSPTGTAGLNSISVDASGTVYTGGGGAKVIDNMAGVLNSSGNIAPYGTYYVFGVTAFPISSPPPSAAGLAPTAVDLSSNVGTPSAPAPVTISNFGGAPLNISGVSATGGFQVTNYCPAQLAAGSNCTVDVTFTPSAVGTVYGTLTVSDDSGNAGPAQTVALSGTGNGAISSVSPSSLTFASQAVGSTSAGQPVTLSNSGNATLLISSITITSPPFSQSNNCNGSVAAGGSCTFTVSFSPESLGATPGSLTISSNAQAQTVTLSGNGTSPLTVSPSSLNFGKVTVGKTSSALTVTVTNLASESIGYSAAITGTGFAVSSNPCNGTLGGGAKCSIGITFKAPSRGTYTGTLTINNDLVNSPQTVSLTGTGK